jgi:hypothetical protein
MVAPKVTWDLIRTYVANRGTGFGEDYNAFLQLKRYNASPISVQTSGRVPPFKRRMHFLCRSEWLIALLLAWIGCHVREQLPLWPWPHPHLLFNYLPQFDRVPWSPGTIELCKQAGIPHGTFIGTAIPYIWTIDIQAILAWLPPEKISSALISVKPLESEEYTGDLDPIARGPQKLEIERRYAAQGSHHYFVADRTLYPGVLLGQLEDLSAAAYADEATVLPVRRLLERGETELSGEPPNDWAARLQTDFGLSRERATEAIRYMIWHQVIDVDLSRGPLDFDAIPRRGGRALIRAMRDALCKELS